MKFGASSWPFQWEPPYEDCIRRVAGLGFKAIELIAWNYRLPRELLDQGQDRRHEEGAEELRHRAFAVRPHAARPLDTATRPSATRRSRTGRRRPRSGPSSARRSSTWCRRIPSPCATRSRSRASRPSRWCRNTRPGTCRAASTGTRISGTTSRRCANAPKPARKAGVKMSVEPHPGRYLANHDGALRLLEHVDHPAMGINFDPSHTFPMRRLPQHHGLSARQEHHPPARLGQ